MTTARLVITGEELVTGKTADVNGPFMAAALTGLGVRVTGIRLVGDGLDEVTHAISAAADAADLVIVSGGLGPTGDDITRTAIGKALDLPLVEVAPPDGHQPQPVPDGAELIGNPRGSAAGLWIEHGDAVLAALPGVPWELSAMWPEVLRRVTRMLDGTPLHTLTLRTVGLYEREAEDLIRPALERINVSYGVTAHPLRVDVHLSAQDERTLGQGERAVREVLGDTVYGTGREKLARVVGEALKDRGLWLAVAESCTGGAISAALTAIPGASAYIERGVVSYTNRAKVELLGVPEALLERHGAVSEPVARAMAEGILTRSGADLALSVTGIAGPTGGSEEKPVGTVCMAVAESNGTFAHTFHHRGDRARVIERTVNRGLDLIRRYLAGGIAGLDARFSG